MHTVQRERELVIVGSLFIKEEKRHLKDEHIKSQEKHCCFSWTAGETDGPADAGRPVKTNKNERELAGSPDHSSLDK